MMSRDEPESKNAAFSPVKQIGLVQEKGSPIKAEPTIVPVSKSPEKFVTVVNRQQQKEALKNSLLKMPKMEVSRREDVQVQLKQTHHGNHSQQQQSSSSSGKQHQLALHAREGRERRILFDLRDRQPPVPARTTVHARLGVYLAGPPGAVLPARAAVLGSGKDARRGHRPSLAARSKVAAGRRVLHRPTATSLYRRPAVPAGGSCPAADRASLRGHGSRLYFDRAGSGFLRAGMLPSEMRSRFFSIVRSPMPLTRASCSALSKRPWALR